MSEHDPASQFFKGIYGRSVNHLTNEVIKGFQTLVLRMARPVATVTEVLLNRSQGERYFGGWEFVGGLVLIGSTVFVQADRPIVGRHANPFILGQDLPADQLLLRIFDWHSTATIVAAAWAVVFVVASALQFQEVRRRYGRREVWHSYCWGVPRIAQLGWPFVPSALVIGLAAGALALGAYGAAGLLLFSRWISHQHRLNETKAMHGRILDAIDQRIEAQHLAKAIEEQPSPDEVEGTRAPLPAYASKAYREQLPEIVSGMKRGIDPGVARSTDVGPESSQPEAQVVG